MKLQYCHRRVIHLPLAGLTIQGEEILNITTTNISVSHAQREAALGYCQNHQSSQRRDEGPVDAASAPQLAMVEIEANLVREYLGKGVGIFVEVGANHPHYRSQTWHLAERGWRGILIEPQREFHELLRQGRPESLVVPAACTSPEHVGMHTLHIPGSNGFATLEPNKDDFYVRYENTEVVEARTLDRIIHAWRATSGEESPVRFVAIDVEGHELEVLKGFALAAHRPDLILIEDKLQDLAKHRYLTARGYRLVRRKNLNNWYIPRHAAAPRVSLPERGRLFRKVFLGLPFRALRRWRHRRKTCSNH